MAAAALGGPYGSWPSPITAEHAAAHDGRPEYVGTVGAEVWWTEPRPEEGGRRTLVRRPADGGAARSVLEAPWNVRSRLTEYGGLPWAGAEQPGRGPLVVFVHHADQRLYAYEPDAPGAAAQPRPLTPVSAVGGGLRWADPVLRGGEVWCVLEEFTGPGPGDLRRVAAAVPLDGSAAGDRSAVRELTDDRHRFRTGPKPSPDGRRAAWLVWDHPRMPWDGTELELADVRPDGTLGAPRTVLGGPDEAVAQVAWAADGTLLAVSDRTGWWNPYRVDPDGGEPVNLCPREEEFGGALWKPGLTWLAPLPEGTVAVLHGQGSSVLGVLDPDTGDLVDAAGPWTAWQPALAVSGTRVYGVAASPRSAYEVVELDVGTRARAGRRSPGRRPRGPRLLPGAAEPHLPRPRRPRDPRPRLPAAPPRPAAARRRTAPVRGVGPRRPHRARPARTGPAHRLLHLARHRRRRGQLRRLHRLRPCLPRAAARTVGRRRRRGLRRRRPGPGRRGHRRPRPARDPRRQRRRLDGHGLPGRHRPVRLRRGHLPGARPARLRRRDPRPGVALHGRPGRPPGHPGPALPGTLPGGPRRPDRSPFRPPPGPGRPRLPAFAGRTPAGRPPRPRAGGPARVPHLRGRGARLPARGDDGAGAGGRTVAVCPGVRRREGGRAAAGAG
ncbi:LOW QUALITY PROTEIN: acyl-peptide hydrolase, partial [Streptomyces sp. C]